MSGPRRARRASRARPPRPAPSPESIGRAAVAHEGEAVLGGKIKLTLRVTLSRSRAERLAARAVSEGKNLDALVSEMLEAAPPDARARRRPRRG
jgi:hypothetical protein